jgi:energy-converting hydrogenase Eha subunit G
MLGDCTRRVRAETSVSRYSDFHLEQFHCFTHFLAFFFAVLAAFLNAPAVGAPLAPGLRIFSPLPALMRARFLAMFL